MLPDGMIRINSFKVCRSIKPSYKLFIESAIIFVTLLVTILYFVKKEEAQKTINHSRINYTYCKSHMLRILNVCKWKKKNKDCSIFKRSLLLHGISTY